MCACACECARVYMGECACVRMSVLHGCETCVHKCSCMGAKCVCMYVCTFLHGCECVCVCSAHVCACLFPHGCGVHVRTCMRVVCVCGSTCVCMCMGVCTCVYVRVHAHTCARACTFPNVCGLCVCVHVCVRACTQSGTSKIQTNCVFLRLGWIHREQTELGGGQPAAGIW